VGNLCGAVVCAENEAEFRVIDVNLGGGERFLLELERRNGDGLALDGSSQVGFVPFLILFWVWVVLVEIRVVLWLWGSGLGRECRGGI
jgi:hypothetical protein